jgi:hypothetical protein
MTVGKFLCSTAVAICLTACSGPLTKAEDVSPPIKVTTELKSSGGTFVRVTSLTDEIKIISLTANRGNCIEEDMNAIRRMVKAPEQSNTIKYGVTNTYAFRCAIIEVTIETDQGSWTYNP